MDTTRFTKREVVGGLISQATGDLVTAVGEGAHDGFGEGIGNGVEG